MNIKINIKKIQLIIFFASAIILCLAVLYGKNLLFCLAFFLWINLFVYALSSLEQRSVLLGFLLAFFLFLIGRDFLEIFLNYKIEKFTEEANNHAYIVYTLSLLTIAVLYPVFSSFKFSKKTVEIDDLYDDAAQKSALIFYYLTIGFAIAAKVVVVRFVASTSYMEYYTDYSSYTSSNPLITIINLIERMMPVALSGFLATMPSKRQLKVPLFFYFIYLIVSLGTGARSTAMLGILFVLIYYLFRQYTDKNETWLNRKAILLIIIAIPLMAILGTVINYVRVGDTTENLNPFYAFLDFFYDQGVTSNIIKRAYIYKAQIPDDTLYTLEFLRSGIFARIFGFHIYYGNSIDRALYGGSFAHTVGYLMLGSSYLAGRGTGSSFLAEFYQDFGYMGCFFGTAIYTLLMANIINVNKLSKNVWLRCIQIYLIQRIIWSPRGSFADIINSVISAPTLFIIFLMYLLSIMIRNKSARSSALEKTSRSV